MRLLTPSLRRLARRLALLGGLVFVGIVYVGPWAQEQLSDRVGRVARSDSTNSPAAYKTLLVLDDSALGVLVENAVASDPAIAGPARAALAVRVDTWRARNATGGSSQIAQHVERVLAELEKQIPVLTYSGKAWVMRFANHLLATTSLVPIKKRGELIASVDHLLDTLAATPTLPDPPARPAAPVVVEADPASEEPVEIETKPIPAIVESIPPPAVLPSPVPEDTPETIVENDPFEEQATDPKESVWQPAWREGQAAEPVPRELASQPSEPKPLVASPAKPLAIPVDNYATATDHQLLAALLEYEAALRASQQPKAAGPTSKPLQSDPLLAARLESLGNALQSRGYRGVSMTHVRMLLSKSVSDRIRLVEQLLVDRTGDTARLLLLLARDESADVRVAAITALGSSPRKELVEAAWALALRDKDARVARVAEQISQRRQ